MARNCKTEYNYVPAPLKEWEWYTESETAKRAKEKRCKNKEVKPINKLGIKHILK